MKYNGRGSLLARGLSRDAHKQRKCAVTGLRNLGLEGWGYRLDSHMNKVAIRNMLLAETGEVGTISAMDWPIRRGHSE